MFGVNLNLNDLQVEMVYIWCYTYVLMTSQLSLTARAVSFLIRKHDFPILTVISEDRAHEQKRVILATMILA